jgi:hypothetical protein
VKIEVSLPLSGSLPVKLVIDVPGTLLNCAQTSKSFGVPLKQVRADCLNGRLQATHARGGWEIPVASATSLYLSQLISESAQVCADIAKPNKAKK